VPDLAGELAQGHAAAGHARPLGIDDASAAKLTREILAQAIDRAGTSLELKVLAKLSWRQISRYSGSLEITEHWSVALPDGPAQRERHILATKIVTAAAADGTVTESVGSDERQLEAGEAAMFRLESRLQPNVLLALVAQGKLELKAVGRITLASQSLIVLAGKIGTDVVHVAIDEKSGLVRRIDWLEWQPKATPRRASLELLDYRPAGRLRAPHLLRKFVDGELRAEIAVEYEK
jgi:hypothetical protein